MKIRFLGTGTSTGVPEVGCGCAVCCSKDTRDNRLRTSILVETRNVRILLDCGPDFRQQMLSQQFAPIDGVILSHEHYDHVAGIDDLRPFCRFGDIHIYAENNVCDAVKTRMSYCFSDRLYPGVPHLMLHEVMPDRNFDIKGVEIVPIRLMHGNLPIFGYRIESMAYLTDVSEIPLSEFDKLRGLDVLIIDALRYEKHPSHENLDQAIANVRRIAPSRAYFIHMSHHIGLHVEVQRNLPDNINLAYDNLIINI